MIGIIYKFTILCGGSKFIWITNGVKNKRYSPDNEIPNGWVKGMVQKGKFYKH